MIRPLAKAIRKKTARKKTTRKKARRKAASRKRLTPAAEKQQGPQDKYCAGRNNHDAMRQIE